MYLWTRGGAQAHREGEQALRESSYLEHFKVPLKIVKVPLNIFRGTRKSVAFNRIPKNIRGTLKNVPLKMVFSEAHKKMPLNIVRGTFLEVPLKMIRAIWKMPISNMSLNIFMGILKDCY